MNHPMKYVTFQNCFIFSVLGFVLAPVFAIINKLVSPTINVPLLSLEAVIFLLLNLYVYVGFIKYSFIAQEEKLRKMIFLVIGILFVDFVLSFFRDKNNFVTSNIFNYLSPMPLASVLLYYGFRLIRNEEMEFFKKLSRLNLYNFFLGICFTILIFSLTKGFTVATRWIFILPFLIVGVVIVIAKLYWEVRLFRHLSSKYDKQFIPLRG